MFLKEKKISQIQKHTNIIHVHMWVKRRKNECEWERNTAKMPTKKNCTTHQTYWEGKKRSNMKHYRHTNRFKKVNTSVTILFLIALLYVYSSSQSNHIVININTITSFKIHDFSIKIDERKWRAAARIGMKLCNLFFFFGEQIQCHSFHW